MIPPELLKKLVLVFDFDGVIVESNDIKTNAFYSLYQDYGLDVANQVVTDHLKLQGVSRFDKIKRWHLEYLNVTLNDTELSRLANRFSDLVFAEIMKCPFVNGLMKFLDEIKGRLPLYIASATPQDELSRIIQGRGLSTYFNYITGFPTQKCNVLINAKGANKDRRVIMLGDSLQDKIAALEAGVDFIARTYNSNRLIFVKDITFSDFNELPNVLKMHYL